MTFAQTDEMTMTVGAVTTVEDGTYAGNLIGLEDFQYGDGDDTKTLRRWKFGLDALDSDGHPAEIDGVSSTALGPKSKAYAWMTALLGRKLEKGESITRSMLVGRECLVEVYQTDDGYSKVKNVIAAPKVRAAAAVTAGTPAENPASTPEPSKGLDVDDIPF